MAKLVYLEGKIMGYSIEDLKEKTLTVEELIGMLLDCDGDAKVYIRNDNGYTYGALNVLNDIWDDYEDEEDGVVFLRGRWDGYTPDQCGETLTVDELIEELENYEEDMPVFINYVSDGIYGAISYEGIEEVEYDEEAEYDRV